MHEPSPKGSMVILNVKGKTAMLINIAVFDRQFRFFTTADSSPAY
jgi:hypothetical protein